MLDEYQVRGRLWQEEEDRLARIPLWRWLLRWHEPRRLLPTPLQVLVAMGEARAREMGAPTASVVA